MTDAVYVVGDNGSLASVPRTAYALEDALQQLIADHPQLLPGDQINPEDPRRWLLIKREAGIGATYGGTRWSLDHLFVDQDATPTLVEAKRGGNPEARREVVAQLLEYAANGTLHWPMDQIRSWFEEQQRGREQAVMAIAGLTGTGEPSEEAYEAFWQRFESNLRERRIRLIFVADVIPSELKTLVEFLNEQMTSVEVLAVEVVQYASKDQRLVRPQLVGQTATARARKESGQAPQRETPWTGPEMIARLTAQSTRAGEVAAQILAWAEKRGDLTLVWNKGLTNARVGLRLAVPGGRLVTICAIWGQGTEPVEITFADIKRIHPFDEVAERDKLWSDLSAAGRMKKGDPSTGAKALVDPISLQDDTDVARLLSVLDGVINRIKEAGVVSAV